MVKRCLNVASIFYFNLSSPSVIQPALLYMQFTDSAGNIAAGALIKTNTVHFIIIYFLNFSSVYTEILRGRGLFHVTGTRKHLCYII